MITRITRIVWITRITRIPRVTRMTRIVWITRITRITGSRNMWFVIVNVPLSGSSKVFDGGDRVPTPYRQKDVGRCSCFEIRNVIERFSNFIG